MYVLFYHTTYFTWVPIAYMAWYFYDLDAGEKGGRENMCVRKICYNTLLGPAKSSPSACRWMKPWCLYKYYKAYFPIKLVKTAELDPEKSYLLGSHPHGILCYGAFAAFATKHMQFDKLFPGLASCPGFSSSARRSGCPACGSSLSAAASCPPPGGE